MPNYTRPKAKSRRKEIAARLYYRHIGNAEKIVNKIDTLTKASADVPSQIDDTGARTWTFGEEVS